MLKQQVQANNAGSEGHMGGLGSLDILLHTPSALHFFPASPCILPPARITHRFFPMPRQADFRKAKDKVLYKKREGVPEGLYM